MKFWLMTILLTLGVTIDQSIAAQKFRSGIFLHHSTGMNIWGPNGSSTSIPLQMTAYNSSHGYTGDEAVTMSEMSYPAAGDNEWERWHRIFLNQASDDIRPILQNNSIVVIKSCFPSSEMSGIGSSSDTLSTVKSLYNYKWHWRAIVSVMQQHPENFFAIWTNAPLAINATGDAAAQLSDQFCRWAKDTLATGLDPLFGEFPKNIYIFDFFHKVADVSGKLPLQYSVSADDSHPNSAATQLVAPMFVQEIFDAAITYETWLNRSVPSTRWNLISIPVLVSDPCKATLFPSAASPAFSYDGSSYTVEDTLQNGVGYWIKLDTGTIIQIDGLPISSDTFDVVSGWNLIGSLHQSLPVTAIASIPSGITTSEFFTFDGSYVVADTISPTHGYWVKTIEAGKLVLAIPPSYDQISQIATINIVPLPGELPPTHPNDTRTPVPWIEPTGGKGK